VSRVRKDATIRRWRIKTTRKGNYPIDGAAGETVQLSADGSSDPDGQELTDEWFVYRKRARMWEAHLSNAATPKPNCSVPRTPRQDDPRHSAVEIAVPFPASYRRAVVTVTNRP
jgi:hypothetical protein